MTTSIEWTDTTWNPVRGCSKVSAGCTHCYAERTAARQAHSGYEGLVHIGEGAPRWTGEVRLVPEKLGEPMSWRKPRRVFVNSMSDLFHEKIADKDIARVFASMALSQRHTFQVLTKRAKRMRHWFVGQHRPNIDVYDAATPLIKGDWSRLPLDMSGTRSSGGAWWPLPNVWLGVSVENQAAADERIPLLLETPAALRFLSVEPLLGPVDLERWFYVQNFTTVIGPPPPKIGWVIVGGESGPGARRCETGWIRRVVEQCKTAGVPVFCKQMGAFVVDRNDAGFEAETWSEVDDAGNFIAPMDRSAWPTPVDVEFDINGHRDDFQGADVRVRLKDRKGGDMGEWPWDLRVRQFPGGRS